LQFQPPLCYRFLRILTRYAQEYPMKADPVKIQRAKRLLAEKRPQREIARLTGLDRSTIRRLRSEAGEPSGRHA